ncbi:MAG: PGF-CTERM sorting domain-containing protein [Archaeoglobaceae archaeon]
MKFRILFVLIFFIAQASGVEISTNAILLEDVYYVIKGEKIDITLLGNPSEEVEVTIIYSFKIQSSGGQYYYSQEKFPVPLKAYFEVKTWPVENLTVEAKLWIFSKKLEANATNDVAKVAASLPFSGNFDVKIYGKAKAEIVNVEAKANAKLKLDENGRYTISYDTSKLPLGEMIVRLDSKQLNVKVVSSLPTTPTPTPNPPQNPTPEPTPEPTTTPTPTPTPLTTSTPAPTPTPTLTPAAEEMQILTPILSTPAITNTPDYTPTPTTTPKSNPNENLSPTPTLPMTPLPTPKPFIPGFEAIFAIAGLLALAFLMRKR